MGLFYQCEFLQNIAWFFALKGFAIKSSQAMQQSTYLFYEFIPSRFFPFLFWELQSYQTIMEKEQKYLNFLLCVM